MKKLFSVLLLLTMVIITPTNILAYENNEEISVIHYDCVKQKYEIGTALIHPQSYNGCKYMTIDGDTYIKKNTIKSTNEDIILNIEECTNEVLNKKKNSKGHIIYLSAYGDIDSESYLCSEIAYDVVPMLKERGIVTNKIWLCVGNKKGKVTDIYYEFSNTTDYPYIFGKTDQIMAPNEEIERQEACVMIYRLLKQNNNLGSFNSKVTKEADWSKNAMDYMYYIGMYSTPQRLSDKITRGEAFRLFAINFNLTQNISKPISYYANLLTDNNYVIGYEDGKLHLNNYLTRAEFCTVYNNITGRYKKKLIDINGKKVTAETYGIKDISPKDWYYEIILKATSLYDGKYVNVENRPNRGQIDYN